MHKTIIAGTLAGILTGYGIYTDADRDMYQTIISDEGRSLGHLMNAQENLENASSNLIRYKATDAPDMQTTVVHGLAPELAEVQITEAVYYLDASLHFADLPEKAWIWLENLEHSAKILRPADGRFDNKARTYAKDTCNEVAAELETIIDQRYDKLYSTIDRQKTYGTLTQTTSLGGLVAALYWLVLPAGWKQQEQIIPHNGKITDNW